MSNNTHSPGPWTLIYLNSPERPGHDEIQIITRRDQRRFDLDNSSGPVSSVPWGVPIARVPIHYWLTHAQSFKPQLAKQRANAELIASAPALYAENQLLRAYIKTLNISMSDVRRTATKLVK